MIIRCEVSLDMGKTWRLATIAREEEPTVYGAACFWQCVRSGRMSSFPAGSGLQI